MARAPKRPSNLPPEAFWKSSKNRWEMGESNNGKAIGYWKIWKKNGTFWMEINYNDNGIIHGTYKRYHENGMLSQEGYYNNGKINGCVKYYRAVNIASKEPFPSEVNNNEIQKVHVYFTNGKKTRIKYFLSNDQEVDNYGRPKPLNIPDGAWWNKDKWEFGNFNEKKEPVGRWTSWRSSGSLFYEANFDEGGQLHGVLKQYHDDGTIATEGFYEENKPVGVHCFYRSYNCIRDNFIRDNFMRNLSACISKQTTTYDTDGNIIKHEYFLKSGEQCNSKGYAVIEADIHHLFTTPVERFLQDQYEKFLDTIIRDGLAPENPKCRQDLKVDFRTYWGIEMPEDLQHVFHLWERAHYPTLFSGFEPQHPKLEQLKNWTAEGKNTVLEAILEMQKWYPYDYLIDWFTGSLCLDSLKQNLDDYYYQYSYHYGLYSKEAGVPIGQIYVHEHNNYNCWSTNFNQVIAPNLSTFIFGVSSLSAFNEYDLLTDDQFSEIYNNSLVSNLAPPYDFVENIKIRNRWLYDDDFTFTTPSKASCEYYTRSKWIIELLRAETEVYNVYHNFYYYQPYKAIAANQQTEMIRRIRESVPEAFYHLWSTFWIKGHENQRDIYIQNCKSSSSIIIKDLALLIESLVNDKNQLGIIRDINKVRTELNEKIV